MSTSGGPVFTFSLPGGGAARSLAPLSVTPLVTVAHAHRSRILLVATIMSWHLVCGTRRARKSVRFLCSTFCQNVLRWWLAEKWRETELRFL